MFDNQDHYHTSDRFPSRDTMLWLNSLEYVRNVDADYAINDDDDYLVVDTTVANVTITLPKAINGRKLVVSNFTGANNVILTSTVNINNSASDLTIATGVTMTIKDIGETWLAW